MNVTGRLVVMRARYTLLLFLLLSLIAVIPNAVAETVPLTLHVVDAGCATGITLTAPAMARVGEHISFAINLTRRARNFSIAYGAVWDNGSVAKPVLTTTNTAPKSFTPKNFTGTRTLILNATLLSADCDETPEDNYAEARVLVTGSPELNGSAMIFSKTDDVRPTPRGSNVSRSVAQAVTGSAVAEDPPPSNKHFAVWFFVIGAGVFSAVLVWKR
jgi:hypothetical protein